MTFRNFGGLPLALLCGGFLLFALLFYSNVPLATDVSMFLAADGRILDGAVPYVDILETNPPLAFWINLPPVWLARILGVPPQMIFVAYICLLTAGALGLTRLVLHSAGESPDRTSTLLLASAAALTLAPAGAFGQREHFAAILVLPYVAAAAQFAEGRAPGAGLRILVGVLCGAGMAFKPYLLAIPALVEGFLLWETRNWRSLVRYDMLGMAASLVAYPFSVLHFTPQYFTEIVPLAQLTYGAYRISIPEIVMRPAVANFGLFAGISAYMIWRAGLRQRGEWVWVIAGLGGLICFLVQAKGWTYQLLPALVFAMISFLVNLASMPSRVFKDVAFGCFGLVMGVTFAGFVAGQNSRKAAIDDLFAGRTPQRIMALTHDPGVLFPYVETNGIVWASRFHSFWMLPAISKELIPAERREAVIARAAGMAAQDLTELKPDFVIVDRRSDTPTLQGKKIDYIEWFSRSAAFARAWSSYRLVKSSGAFEVWELL